MKLFITIALLLLLLITACTTPQTTQQSATTPPTVLLPTVPNTSDYSTYVKPNNTILLETLTTLEYQVTQDNGTENPYDNTYWNNEAPGIYVDIVSGEPLFSSTNKYDSGTGWPSFYQPLDADNIVTVADNSLGMQRTEVRSKHSDDHLGHLFNDGPPPTGLRYCMDSASLRFIPAANLTQDGYGQYAYLFANTT